jgi:hypothetical protein
MQQRLTLAEWKEKGTALFGSNMLKWRFRCPACGHVQTPEDFRQHKDRGADPNTAYQECIGRYLPKDQRGGWSKDHSNPKVKYPCDYAGYGFFKLSPVTVVADDGKEILVFGFAEQRQEAE